MNIRIIFTSPETRMIVLPDAENCTIVSSFVWTKHQDVTERQTDRIPLAIVCPNRVRCMLTTTNLTCRKQELQEHGTAVCLQIIYASFKVFLEDRDEQCIGNDWWKVVPDASCHSAEGTVTDRRL